MKYIQYIQYIKFNILNFKKKDKKHLGRWNIDYDAKRINNKVDLSNEDHCGPCGLDNVFPKPNYKNLYFKKT